MPTSDHPALNSALSHPGLLRTPPDPAASLAVAIALGQCRLYGIPLPDDACELPEDIAEAAAVGFLTFLHGCEDDAYTMADRYKADDDLMWQDGIAIELPDNCNLAWAAWIILMDADFTPIEISHRVTTAISRYHNLISEPVFAPFWRRAHQTFFCKNMANLFRLPYRTPWWLLGTNIMAAWHSEGVV